MHADVATNRTFIRGAMILGVAALISKIMGSVYTVVLQNVIGDRGMGLYQMAYPIYATLLIISTAGVPVAVSKFVSEYAAVGDIEGAQRIYRVSLWLLTVVGVGCAAALFIFAEPFARLSGDPNAVFAIRAIAPALLVVPALSSMRGYFQGWQVMNPTAISQVVEQFVRVITIIAGAYVVLHFGFGDSSAAAAAAFGAVSGGVAGFGVMGYFLRRMKRDRREAPRRVSARSQPRRARLSTFAILRKLVYYSVPVSLGALVVPLTSNVDALTVTNLLKLHGAAQAAATSEFGLLAGRASKLMMFPAALAGSIGVALLPSISEANAMRDDAQTSQRILLGMRITTLFALPAAVGLFLLAKPIDIALFQDSAGYHAIQILALATFFSTLQTSLCASLQGVGAVYLPVGSLVVGTALKVALNFVLVPPLGIDGAAMATVLSYALASLLNWLALRRYVTAKVPWADYVWKPAAATFVMAGCTFAALAQWHRLHIVLTGRLNAGAVTLVGVTVGALVYGLALLVSGALQESEVAALPRIGCRLAAACRRLGLFES